MQLATASPRALLFFALTVVFAHDSVHGHGTVFYPISRVYRVYLANPDHPSFALAAEAVALDGTLSYYTWNEVSRNISEAVTGGLSPGFDYSPWMPDGQLASAGRIDPLSSDYARTYAGLDQVSPDWPTTRLTAGETIEVDFLATAPHDPSVWDVWMTTPDWTPDTELNWAQLEFLGRPTVELIAGHYSFDLEIPSDRSGHHVLWVAWQRDDPVGEVFVSTSDIWVESTTPPVEFERGDCNSDQAVDIADVITTLDALFLGAPAPGCDDACDSNDDGAVNVADAVKTLSELFGGGIGFPEPSAGCGVDPSADGLTCARYAVCP